MNESNEFKFSPDDPKLTAYALGEIEDAAERAAIEAALRDDPAARAIVDEIRATAAQLEAALAAEPMPVAAQAAGRGGAVAPVGENDAARAPRPQEHPKRTARKSKVLRFPQLYYLMGGLAAACFALLLAFAPERPITERHFYTEIPLSPPEGAPQDASAPAMVALPSSELEHQMIAGEEKAAREQQLATARAREFAKDVSRLVSKRRAGLAMQQTVVTPLMMASADANTESYAFRPESDFLSARENPLSTFSADVDTASYANVRRFLDSGRLPPPDAVRIEELLNYFPYRYAPPAGDAPFAASMEVADAPWAPAHRLVRIGLKGREVAAAERGAANLVFLLDVSGSMEAPNKLPLVKESMRLLLGRLRPDDHVAIVTYAGASGLALPSTPASHTRDIVAALDRLTPEGSTNGAMGIQLAYDIAKANFVRGGVNRVILCTDGDFNVGVSDDGGLHRLITEKAKSGVFLTALGFGMGNYQDAKLQQLADAGNGNYGYIDTRREAEKLLVEQVSGTLVTIAKDVKLQVEFNPAQVASYRLIGYEKRALKKEDFNNDAVDAGEIGAGHTVTALYEVVPVGAPDAANASGPAVDALKYQPVSNPSSDLRTSNSERELLTLKVRYKEPDGDVSRKLEFPLVDRGERFADASDDFQFAAAVAGFGMILRDSPHKGSATYASVTAWAQHGLAADPGGYRAGFVGLVHRAEMLVQ
jgi:Ca-activated chloride channel family protein